MSTVYRLLYIVSCMHLKHNTWPTPHPSFICVQLLGGSRQPVTGRLVTHTSNTTVNGYSILLKYVAVLHASLVRHQFAVIVT